VKRISLFHFHQSYTSKFHAFDTGQICSGKWTRVTFISLWSLDDVHDLEVLMSRRLRIVLAAIVLVLLVLLIVPFFIPVNQFRPVIEEKATAALGRKVTVGNLSFSLLTGSVTAQDLAIGEDTRFGQSPFLTAKSLKVGVELVPLIFSKKLNVTGVTIDQPQVTLLRNAAGQWNVSSLGETGAKPEPTSATTAPAAPSSTTTGFSVKKIELNNGRVIIGSTESRQRSTYDHVNVTVSNFSMASQFPVTVTADLPGGGKFGLDGNAGPIDATDASLTPLDAKLDVSNMNLASTGFLDPSAGLGGLLDLKATLRSQNGVAETKGNATLSKALLVAGGSPASEPVSVDFNTTYDLRKNSGVLNPSTLKIGNAVAQLNGTYQTAGENTVVNVNLNGQNMPAKDLVAFLPAVGIHLPNGASLPAGTLNTALNISGPTNKLVTTGNVGLFGAKLAGFDLGSKMSAISALTGVQTGKDLQIDKLTTNLRIAPEGLKADNFLLVAPALGDLTGGGTIDSKNNLDFKMAAILSKGVGGAATPVSAATGLLGKLTGGGSGCNGRATVPFLVQGTTSDPKFVPDIGGLAKDMLKSQLGCAGGTSAAATAQKPASPLKSIEGLFGKKNKH
jgi:AsmA protein